MHVASAGFASRAFLLLAAHVHQVQFLVVFYFAEEMQDCRKPTSCRRQQETGRLVQFFVDQEGVGLHPYQQRGFDPPKVSEALISS